MTKFPNYVIVYRPETNPLQVVAVLHGKRDLKEVLEERS
jgi:plasmid stabilization system protein ParE